MVKNDAYARILEVLQEHREDGYRVHAVRISEDQFNELLLQREFIRPEDPDVDIELDHGESIGMAAGTEIIVDEDISDVVADDVIGDWR